MPDVKKLITSFLILALGASTSAWILSSNTSGSSGIFSNVQGQSAMQSLGNNAFANTGGVPQDITDLMAEEAASSTEIALNDPNNITAALGSSVIDGLSSANPDGVQTDDNGNGQINTPNNEQMLAELL